MHSANGSAGQVAGDQLVEWSDMCVLAEIINGPSGGNSEMGDGPDAGAIMTISLCVCVSCHSCVCHVCVCVLGQGLAM